MSYQDKFKINEIFLPRIKEYGYTICGVFDKLGEEPNFVYTISATNKFKAEYIFVGKAPINMLHGILANMLENGIVTEGEHTLKDFKVKVDGELQNARIKLVEVTGEEWLDETILNRSTDFDKVYQVLFADVNNNLPTDNGNSDSFGQMFYSRPKLKC